MLGINDNFKNITCENLKLISWDDKNKLNTDYEILSVFVKLPGMNIKTFIFNELMTGADVKLLIESETGISMNNTILYCRGKIINSSDTLKMRMIGSDNTIHVIVKLCGGMYHATSGKNGGYCDEGYC